MGTSADVPSHPEHPYRAPYDREAYKRIATLQAELERREVALVNAARWLERAATFLESHGFVASATDYRQEAERARTALAPKQGTE